MIIEWNNLDCYLRNALSIGVFKHNILKFIRVGPNKVYTVHNPTGLKLLAGLCLGLSIYVLISPVIILVIVSMNYVFAELILNLQTISSSNAHYIYPKGKPLWSYRIRGNGSIKCGYFCTEFIKFILKGKSF